MDTGIRHIFNKFASLLMVQRSTCCGVRFNDPDDNGDTPLHHALRSRNTAKVLCLLGHGVSVIQKNADGMTALHFAVLFCVELDIIHAILSKRINVNIKDVRQCTPLHLACNKRIRSISVNFDIVECLIQYGANANKRNIEGITPFLLACKYGDLEVVANFIFQFGANSSTVCNKRKSALHYAIRGGRGGVIKLLLSKGININDRDIFGRTPLHYTQCNKIVNLLAYFGANIDAVDNEGNTALHLISGRSCSSVLRLVKGFFELKSDIINDLNDYGETPLEYALKYAKEKFSNKIHNFWVLIKQIAIQMKLGKKISKVNIELIQKNEEAYSFYKMCERELNDLKETKICGSKSNVSFIEFLIKDVYTLAAYCNNEDLCCVLNCDDSYKNFPIYEDYLHINFTDAKDRRLHLDVALAIFQDLLKYEIPGLLLNQIFGHLGLLDLEYFIKGFVKSGVEYVLKVSDDSQVQNLTAELMMEWNQYRLKCSKFELST